MDNGDRIPIDLGYQVAASAPEADQRTTLREDGTIVIDILAPQPCDPLPSSGSEIVVCGQAPGESETPVAVPADRNLSEKIRKALTVKIGPVEIGPGGPDGAAGFTARIRF